MSQEGNQSSGGSAEADDTKDLLIANGGLDSVVPQAAAASEAIFTPKPDTENDAADDEINKAGEEINEESCLETETKSDAIPAANGVPDTSTSTTTMVPTEADLEELEKAAQTKQDETPNILQMPTEESEAIPDNISVKTEESGGENSTE